MYLDGSKMGDGIVDDNGTWTYNHTDPSLTVGVHQLTAISTDRAGNVSQMPVEEVDFQGSEETNISVKLANLRGTSEDDILTGTANNEIIAGFEGMDTLMGGGGEDVFLFHFADIEENNSRDIIVDFDKQNDVLDLADMLYAEKNADTLDDYLHFERSADGEFTSGFDQSATDHQIVLKDVDLTNGGLYTDTQILEDLLTNRALQTDVLF